MAYFVVISRNMNEELTNQALSLICCYSSSMNTMHLVKWVLTETSGLLITCMQVSIVFS